MALEEARISQIASQNTRRIAMSRLLNPNVIVAGGTAYSQQGEGMFMLLERLDGSGVRFDAMVQRLTPARQRFPHIHDTLCLIRQVLLALHRCHENNVWFGDIQPGNIFLCDAQPQYREMGIGMLLDFSASHMMTGGTTEVLENVFTTEGFAAPELYEPNPQVGPEADIYSVGALLLRCILEPEEIEARVEGQTVDARRGQEIGCGQLGLRMLNRLIDDSVAWEPERRFPNADAMLRSIEKLIDEVRPARHRLPRNLSAPEFFLPGSREKQIADILQTLERGESPIILHGIGGIGKSEIAIRVGQLLNPRRNAYLLHWKESTCRTIGSLFDRREAALSEEELFERNFCILQEEFADSVLILDNFYREDKSLDDLLAEPHFRRLRDLSPTISLLITTRYAHSDSRWRVEEMSETELLDLMRYFLRSHQENEDTLLKLIRRVDRHTLTVKLIAQTLEAEEGRVTAAQLLEILSNNALNRVKIRPVVTDQDRSQEKGQIYQHLKKLFNYTNLSLPQRQMMAIACILPESGMGLDLLRSCLNDQLDEARWELQRRGWLELRGATVVTHPVIAQVCWEIDELLAADEFLSELSKIEHTDAAQLRQIAETCANASEHLYPVMSMKATICYRELGDIPKAVHYAYLVEQQMKNKILKKMKQAERETQEAAQAAQKDLNRMMRAFLEDRSMTVTPGFVLCRHLQKRFPEQMHPTAPDLYTEGNTSWTQEAAEHMGQFLAQICTRDHGFELRKRDWARYLLDQQTPQKREIAFKIILATKMNVETALDYLLACSMEPFSAREVLDVVVLFCVEEPGSFTWADVENMCGKFWKSTETGTPAKKPAPEQMTQWIRVQSKNNHSKSSKEEAKDAMLLSMSRCYDQFQKEKQVPLANNRTANIQLEGFSKGRYQGFRRFAEYLELFYNTYVTERAERLYDGEDTLERQLMYDDQGIPCFATLAKAILYQSGMDRLEWKKRDYNAKNLRMQPKQTIPLVMRCLPGKIIWLSVCMRWTGFARVETICNSSGVKMHCFLFTFSSRHT